MKTVKRLAVAGTCVAGILLASNAVDASAVGFTQSSDLSELNVFTPASSSHSRAYFISPSGSDSNPGTKSAPFKTLMKAQSAASAGDIVYIRGGVYDHFDNPKRTIRSRMSITT